MKLLPASLMTVIFAASATAAPLTTSIGINFASDAFGSHTVNGPAGVLDTATWNNTTGANGSGVSLNTDSAGTSAASSATISWSGPATFASFGNDTASDPNDYNLMFGYLESYSIQPVSMTLSGLTAAVGSTYDVYVYYLGDTPGANREGEYEITGATAGNATQSGVSNLTFTGIYVVGQNYLLFSGVSGNSFTLTSTVVNSRAPVNAIEIVSAAAVPEPATALLTGVGIVVVLGALRRRKV